MKNKRDLAAINLIYDILGKEDNSEDSTFKDQFQTDLKNYV